MNKLRWLTLMLCLVSSSVLRGQSVPYYQSHFPPEEFKARWEKVFEQIGDRALLIYTPFAPAEGHAQSRAELQTANAAIALELKRRNLGAKVHGASAIRGGIVLIDPPEKDFFSKRLDFHGIPIKAHQVVVDEALFAAYDRLSLLFTNLLIKQPIVISNLVAAGAALHIIGRDQVTTDLPEWRHDKGVPRPEYNGLTRDQRTRGMGGRLTSCGEENLLKLEKDRYRGRDICLHEVSHSVRNNGIQREIRARFDEQHKRSLEKALWQKSYAGSNPDEFFAELTMWYFGTHGDLRMTGPKPENGPEGLKNYDPEAFALFDDFYGGRMEITRVEPRRRGRPSDIGSTTPTPASLGSTVPTSNQPVEKTSTNQ